MQIELSVFKHLYIYLHYLGEGLLKMKISGLAPGDSTL